ncbi:MAG: hypothetical protein NTZ46_03280 [Verrucomicrobia bacterium]|nr:hypothetical protein [Verrucomicrobiota bacterium]
MRDSFFQKFLLVVFLAALTAGGYVVVYKKLIVGADESINGGYKKPAAISPAAKRRF